MRDKSGVSAEAAHDCFLHFGERKAKGSHQHDVAPLLKRQMGRVEDYLHRAGMYIGNLQKSADWSQDHKTMSAHTRDEMKLPSPHPSIVVSLVK